MKPKLLLVLMLLCTCGNAAIIEHFSIEIGQIYKKDSEEVGHVIKSVSA